jgi:hypothetical protein
MPTHSHNIITNTCTRYPNQLTHKFQKNKKSRNALRKGVRRRRHQAVSSLPTCSTPAQYPPTLLPHRGGVVTPQGGGVIRLVGGVSRSGGWWPLRLHQPHRLHPPTLLPHHSHSHIRYSRERSEEGRRREGGVGRGLLRRLSARIRQHTSAYVSIRLLFLRAHRPPAMRRRC